MKIRIACAWLVVFGLGTACAGDQKNTSQEGQLALEALYRKGKEAELSHLPHSKDSFEVSFKEISDKLYRELGLQSFPSGLINQGDDLMTRCLKLTGQNRAVFATQA